MIHKLIRFFVPAEINSSTAEYQGMVFKVSCLLTTGLISFLYIFLATFVEFYIAVYVCIIFVLNHAFMLFSLRGRWLNDNTISHIFGLMTLAGLGTCTYFTGGYDSPILVWFSSTLVVSFWFSDEKTSRFWIGLVLFCFSLFFLGYAIDHYFPVALNLELYSFFKFCMGAGVFLYLIIVFVSLQSWRVKAVAELSELNRTKDRMISIVAHDLKNPLMVMMGHIGLAKAGKPLNEKSLSLFESLNSRMKQIIDNMLIFERLQSGEYNFNHRDLGMNELLLQLVEEFRDQAIQKNIQLNYVGQTGVVLRSDQLALERIISNIISNALKYTPSFKKVTITLHSDRLEIEDQGIGLSDEVMASLFTIYSPCGGKIQHDKDISNGIGLYIVKQLSDQLGIRLEVFSAGVDQGAKFTLHFPKDRG